MMQDRRNCEEENYNISRMSKQIISLTSEFLIRKLSGRRRLSFPSSFAGTVSWV